ncbi:MAG TPA: branched-chain amino acid ABC transporter permease [Chloroflexota bacterium]|jgi:branched-chain amino acid transport system permease protein
MLAYLLDHISTVDFILLNVALGLSIYLTLAVGLLSLANAGFLAIGAYTAAILTAQAGWPALAGLPVALLLGALVAAPLGLLVLRLQGVYLAIATIGFGEIVRIAALNGDKLLRALSGDDRLTVFRGAEGITLPYRSPQLILGLPETTWLLLLYVLALAYLLATLQGSRYGRLMVAIRLDALAANTLGVDAVRSRLLAFVLGAAIAAGAGALSTPVVRVIDPSQYGFNRAVDILAYAVLGGMTTWVGPIVGATVLTALPEVLRPLQAQRDVVNGLLLLLSIIYLPRGLADPRLWGGWRQWPAALRARRLGGTAAEPSPAPPRRGPG